MQPLIPDTSFHIYNHANGFENVFRETENYRFFLEKYCLHISPVAETYAYCLMPNHFHLVVRMRKREVIEELIRNKKESLATSTLPKFQTLEVFVASDDEIEKFLSKQFSNLFSSYTQSLIRCITEWVLFLSKILSANRSTISPFPECSCLHPPQSYPSWLLQGIRGLGALFIQFYPVWC